MTSLNEQQKRTIALQASGEYLMNHIAGVMEMVQDQHALHNERDEETLITIEAQVKAFAEEHMQPSQRLLIGGSLTKKERSPSMQRRKDKTDDDNYAIFRATE